MSAMPPAEVAGPPYVKVKAEPVEQSRPCVQRPTKKETIKKSVSSGPAATDIKKAAVAVKREIAVAPVAPRGQQEPETPPKKQRPLTRSDMWAQLENVENQGNLMMQKHDAGQVV